MPLMSQAGDIDWAKSADDLQRRMFNRMNEHGIVISDSDVIRREVWSPAEWSSRFGLFDGSAFGAAHNLRQIGPFRPRNVSTEIDGLFFAGASTTPGTGVPMCVLSGKMAAERVQQRVAKGAAA